MPVNNDVARLARLTGLALKILGGFRNRLTHRVLLKDSFADGRGQFNVPDVGTTDPLNPADGDIWGRSLMLFRRVAGVTRTIWDEVSLPTVSQAIAEAGTDTVYRVWNALRVAQAIRYNALIPYSVAVGDESTDLTTGTAKVTFRAPFACAVVQVRGSLNAGGTTQPTIFDVNEAGASIFGANKLSIDAGEKTSVTAATAADLTDTAWADDAEITIDIDQVATGAKGGKITFMLRRTG